MRIKVYLAAPFQEQERMKFIREYLNRGEVEVTSRWLDVKTTHHNQLESDDDRAAWAEKDLEDIHACNLFIAYNPPNWHGRGSGGRHVELGYALALRKPILYVGEKENLFHYHTGVIERVDAGADMLKVILRVTDRLFVGLKQSER